MAHELTRLPARGGEAEPHEDVVQPALEQPQQVLARNAGLARGLVVVAVELLLEKLVVAARLLLLAKLGPILRLAKAASAVLARRVGAPLHAALLGEASLSLEEQLLPLAAALLALRSGVARHA